GVGLQPDGEGAAADALEPPLSGGATATQEHPADLGARGDVAGDVEGVADAVVVVVVAADLHELHLGEDHPLDADGEEVLDPHAHRLEHHLGLLEVLLGLHAAIEEDGAADHVRLDVAQPGLLEGGVEVLRDQPLRVGGDLHEALHVRIELDDLLDAVRVGRGVGLTVEVDAVTDEADRHTLDVTEAALDLAHHLVRVLLANDDVVGDLLAARAEGDEGGASLGHAGQQHLASAEVLNPEDVLVTGREAPDAGDGDGLVLPHAQRDRLVLRECGGGTEQDGGDGKRPRGKKGVSLELSPHVSLNHGATRAARSHHMVQKLPSAIAIPYGTLRRADASRPACASPNFEATLDNALSSVDHRAPSQSNVTTACSAPTSVMSSAAT